LHRSWCHTCEHAYHQKNSGKINARIRKWQGEHKEYRRDYNYQRYYGIDLVEYNRLFKVQDGKCAICGMHQSEHKQALAVDHDHITKEVRGLLCHKCNRGLGLFDNSPETMAQAIKYLKRTS
jgi:hypothetical protein